MNSLTCNTKHWFALKVFYNKVFEIEESLEKEQIKSYIPCEEVLIVRNGIKKTVRKPVINSLMFFQSTILEAVNIQERFKDKVILYTRNKDGRKRPLAIPEREMNIFMLVSSSGEQGMEYFGADEPKFHCGEHVKVIDGKFKGAEGYICRIRKNSRLVVVIEGVCAVVTSYIPKCFLAKIP